MVATGNNAVSLALEMPSIPLPAYHMCGSVRNYRFEMAYLTLSLFFGNRSPTSSSVSLPTRTLFLDAMAFSMVVFVNFGTGLSFANGERLPGGRPSILRTILEDATVYFLVIFGSHLVSLVGGLVARVRPNILVAIWTISNRLAQPSLQLLPSK